MKERPILMNAEMVRATLEGRKTRRRIYQKKGGDPSDIKHIVRRILNGIDSIDDRGCWIWGRTTSASYGSMTIAGKAVRVHRLSLAIAMGVDERSLQEVCHSCDNPLCINPDHLRNATHRDNVVDSIRRKRLIPPVMSFPGESNPGSKLTTHDVIQIRKLLDSGMTQRQIASRFGVTQSTVSLIKQRKTWGNE